MQTPNNAVSPQEIAKKLGEVEFKKLLEDFFADHKGGAYATKQDNQSKLELCKAFFELNNQSVYALEAQVKLYTAMGLQRQVLAYRRQADVLRARLKDAALLARLSGALSFAETATAPTVADNSHQNLSAGGGAGTNETHPAPTLNPMVFTHNRPSQHSASAATRTPTTEPSSEAPSADPKAGQPIPELGKPAQPPTQSTGPLFTPAFVAGPSVPAATPPERTFHEELEAAMAAERMGGKGAAKQKSCCVIL